MPEMSDILFADDDEAMRRMVADVLRAGGHEVRLAGNGEQALAELRHSVPDMAVLDYRMGRPDGLEVCREIRADALLAHLPVLILTGEGRMEDRLEGFDAGADDYLPKPFDPRELLARVSALLRQARRGLDRNPTTGLPGGDAIRAEIERRRVQGRAFAVCYFDLDHFKPFSDRFGFNVADAAIREAGEAVRALVGEEVFVGHIGGDDFVLLCRPQDAHGLAEAARSRFRRDLPRHLPNDEARSITYRAADRYGVEREFPMTRLSAAIVRVDAGAHVTLEALGSRVAEVKREAKRDDGPGIAEADLSVSVGG